MKSLAADFHREDIPYLKGGAAGLRMLSSASKIFNTTLSKLRFNVKTFHVRLN